MSKSYIHRIDDLGRVVIPKEIRKSLGIEAGDELRMCALGDYITMWNETAYKKTTDVLDKLWEEV